MKRGAMQAVEIEWLDSGHDGGHWQDRKEAYGQGKRPLTCRSAGWLLRDNKHGVTLVLSHHSGDAGQVMAALTIPRAAIVRRWSLERKG